MKTNNSWCGVAGGGMFEKIWMTKVGMDPGEYNIFGFAFGLDRCAMIKHNLDDIHALWRPPYLK